MQVAVLICMLCALVAKADPFTNVIFEEWKTFQMEFGKNYTDGTEEYFRMKIFIENREKIAKHNQLYAQGLVTYKLGINQFTDMLEHEFVEPYTGFEPLSGDFGNETFSAGATFIPPENVNLPDAVDWRHHGAVTPVKDQGQCGSCWAFSATGSLEGQHFRKTGHLVSLSEQNLMDCSRPYHNNGCHGGNPVLAFIYVIRNGGIDTEVSYPYRAVDRSQCYFNRATIGATAKAYGQIPSKNENALMNAVASVGPISAAIHVGNTFMHYSGGVYYDPSCSEDQLNHAVTIVGYGVEGNTPYWLVKNSWGNRWGESGYIKMARNKNNNCGVASFAAFPIV